MGKADKLQDTLYAADQILQRALLLTGDAPFWMHCREDFASIVIDGETATLSWPEVESGYYNSCSIETQSTSFPSELLLMSVDEIKVWKVEQRAIYDEDQRIKHELELRARAVQQTNLELQTLAALKAKYEKPQ